MNTFHDRAVTISATKVLAATLGTAGLLCAILNFWMPHDNLGFMAAPLVAAGGVLRIKSYFCSLNRRWVDAFEMGREVGHEEAGGRQVRSLR